MNTSRTPARDVEEEWIVKYRAALNAAPIAQSRATRLFATLTHACSVLHSLTVRAVDAWLRWQSSAMNPSLQPKLISSQRLQAPFLRNDYTQKDESKYRKVS